MSLNLRFGDNAVVVIICGLIALVAILFFVVIYVVDYKESRRKAKKRREFEQTIARAQRRKQKAH